MTDEPTEAAIYMEICAALMTAAGTTEVEIDMKDLPTKPFELWRRVGDGKVTVRLILEDCPASTLIQLARLEMSREWLRDYRTASTI